MKINKNLKELQKLLDSNANFIDQNIAFANKMLSQVPDSQQGDMRDKLNEIKLAVKNLDKGKLIDIAKDLKNNGR